MEVKDHGPFKQGAGTACIPHREPVRVWGSRVIRFRVEEGELAGCVQGLRFRV